MEIYRKVVIDMSTGNTVYKDSFIYNGEVALCCFSSGGGDINVPGPTQAEQDLQQLQLELLQQQKEQHELMTPFILQELGLGIDAEGQYYKLSEEELLKGMSELEKGQYELTMAQQERLQQALAGELPISPALEQDLAKQEAQMSEALAQRLGSGWEETTAGQQAMSTYQQRADLVREEARRGAIQGGSQAALASLGASYNIDAMQAQGYSAYPGRTGGLFEGYSAAMSPYQQQRQMELNASIYSQQTKAQSQAGLWGGIGQLLGTGISTYGMLI